MSNSNIILEITKESQDCESIFFPLLINPIKMGGGVQKDAPPLPVFSL